MDRSDKTVNQPRDLSQRIIYKLLSKITYGKITLHDGDASTVFAGQADTQTDAVTITVKHPRVYKTVLLGGSLSAGTSYINGDWEVDNLVKLIEIFIKNKTLFERIDSPMAKVLNFMRRLVEKFRLNNIARAKTNIHAHYDLGNEFFKVFLDPTMMYSCALYEPENINLEQASAKKLARVCDYLQLKPSDHVLEIGTGWGGFAFFAARNYGCKITTTTISEKQYQYVNQEIKRLGLENQIELLNMDYRLLTGQYDKVVSIEMIEAVGHQYFDTFFRKCNELVKPDGLFFLQSIVINDQAYDAAKDEIDFIKKYIFPGGCLPSINVISQSVASQTKMQLIALRDIGKHYVNTLNHWHHNMMSNKELITQQGFPDSFIRMWQYYFCYCAAAFNTHYISDIHALWRKHQ